MKPLALTHLVSPLLGTLVVVGVSACTGNANEGGDDDLPMVGSDVPYDQDPQLDPEEIEALAADNHALSLDLYHALREGQAVDRSFSLSAYSIQTAFGMLYGGTVDPARAEMESALHFSLADERQHVAFNWLDHQLSARNLPGAQGDGGMIDPVVVEPANGVWALDTRAEGINPDYLDLLATHYDTGVFLADFLNETELERTRINAWVSARTHELIPELFAPGIIKPDTTMVLVNAFYLKAPWNQPFEGGATSKQPFTLLDGSTVEVDMMSAYEMAGTYGEGEGWQAVALPLRGGALELIAIVPDDFTSFEAGLDVATLDGILASLSFNTIEVELPRFRLSSSFGLNDELRELGMNTPFDDISSFDDIVTDLGVITDVVHKTVISVDEKGTEAAAATGIVVGEDDGSGGPQVSITIDRPFMLIIRDEPTDTLLFLGRVLDPTAG